LLRQASAILALLLFSVVLVSLPQIGILKAEDTIYIRADGTVEGTDKIQWDGNVYTLTGNINGSIVVEKNNITIDGNDYTLQAGIGTGIYLFGRENVAVQNTQIKTFGYGIVLNSSSNNHINENNITENHGDGIYLYSSSNNSISRNNITNSDWGIYLHYSYNNIFYHNNFIGNRNYTLAGASTSVWDNGAEGNYWSNYEERYPNATEIENSGIWDTPYVIDGKNKDNYPLVNVIPEFPSWIILPLFLMATFVGVIVKKRLPSRSRC